MKKILMISIIFTIMFVLLAYLMSTHHLVKLDNFVYNHIALYINSNNTNIMKIITSFGSASILISIALVTYIFTYIKKRYLLYGQMLVIILLSSHLITTLLKSVFHRIRPDILRLVTETSYSFPSAHASVSMCFYGFIIYMIMVIVKSKWKYLISFILLLLIISIGFSRIYLGVHYTSDVLAGLSLGIAILSLSIYFIELKRSKELNADYENDEMKIYW